jgi:hypothetical protein
LKLLLTKTWCGQLTAIMWSFSRKAGDWLGGPAPPTFELRVQAAGAPASYGLRPLRNGAVGIALPADLDGGVEPDLDVREPRKRPGELRVLVDDRVLRPS